MDFECDIAIIGGGPAGSAAALTLLKMHPGLNIIIFEASEYQQFRPGETLSPPVTALLKELGCTAAFPEEDFIASPGTRSAWGGQQSENDFFFFANGTGWHVRRERFDKMLADLAQTAGARVMTGLALHSANKDSPLSTSSLASKPQPDSRWQLLLKDQATGRLFSCHTSWVIDASGRKASFARRAGARMIKMDRLCSVMRIYQLDALKDPETLKSPETLKDPEPISSRNDFPVEAPTGDDCFTEIEAASFRAQAPPVDDCFTEIEAASFRIEAPPGDDCFTEIEAAKDGWWYTSPIPGNKFVVSWMSDTDLVKSQGMDQPSRWEEALSKAPASFTRLKSLAAFPQSFAGNLHTATGDLHTTAGNIHTATGDLHTTAGNLHTAAGDLHTAASNLHTAPGNLHTAASPLHIYPADTRLLSSFSGDHWIAAGDACYTVDPLSGQGILKALRSGMVAAYAVADERKEKGSGLPKFDLFTRTEFQVYLNQRWSFYREGVPPAYPTVSLFWKRRTAPVTISPHAILETREKDLSQTIGIDCPLMPAECYQLLSCLGQGRLTAAEGIRKFKTLKGQSVSDERLIAGLQYFLQTGRLEIVSTKSISLLNT